MRQTCRILFSVLTFLALAGCSGARQPNQPSAEDIPLVGAWRAGLQFETGALSTFKDMEFLYVFNAGGTMTESSNYDAAPPVPPAYGIWKKSGPREYRAKYEFYVTRPAAANEAAAAGGGWLPAGRGILVETITLSEDGNSFSSNIRYEFVDQAGKAAAGGGIGKGRGLRISLE